MWQAVHQSSAVLGLGLIGMAEDLGNAMAHRALEHLLQYGDTAVRCGPCLPLLYHDFPVGTIVTALQCVVAVTASIAVFDCSSSSHAVLASLWCLASLPTLQNRPGSCLAAPKQHCC